MKCLCPGTDNRPVNVHTSMVQGPEYLFIELRRYRILAGNQSKSKQVVNIDQVMTLPCGEQYSLLSVVDHQGDSIHSGHYVAFVKSGKFWYLVNDSDVKRVAFKSLSSPDNILLLYSKSLIEMVISEPETVVVDSQPEPSVMVSSKPESSANESEMVTSQPESMLINPKPESSAKKAKETCLKCGKQYQHIFRHIQGNDICREKYDFNAERLKYNKFISELKIISKDSALKSRAGITSASNNLKGVLEFPRLAIIGFSDIFTFAVEFVNSLFNCCRDARFAAFFINNIAKIFLLR